MALFRAASKFTTPLSTHSSTTTLRACGVGTLLQQQRSFAKGPKWRHTTILCVRKGKNVVMAGDGQVSMGNIVYKPNVSKVRLLDEGRVITGVAGGTADAIALLEILEGKLSEFPGQLKRACVEMAKEWRKDKFMRRFEAQLVVCDKNLSLLLTGNGDVFEPHDDIIAIGSGAQYATAAARALVPRRDVEAEEIVKTSMKIAADICVFTNHNLIVKKLENLAEPMIEYDDAGQPKEKEEEPAEAEKKSEESSSK